MAGETLQRVFFSRLEDLGEHNTNWILQLLINRISHSQCFSFYQRVQAEQIFPPLLHCSISLLQLMSYDQFSHTYG